MGKSPLKSVFLKVMWGRIIKINVKMEVVGRNVFWR